jgi:hypothetical protein
VDVLHGYWLHTSGAVTLNLAGRLPWPVSIPLCAGWNLIGYPSAAPVPLPDALASIAGKYDAVFAYDSTDPIDPWKQYDPAAPPGANDLLALEPGKGYWIRATASTVLKVP